MNSDAPDLPTDEPDENRVGRYVLGERLAAGGMAELFAAESLDRHYEVPVVIKRMLPRLARDRSFVAMFIEEARISTLLEHPNVVRVFDFEATDQGLCLVMELVDGPDLLAVLRRCAKQRAALPEELAAYIACHVLEALDYVHALEQNGQPLRLVHHDVSPSNILISRKGHVKLADFGIARATAKRKEGKSSSLKGKYGYMSPEQVKGEPQDHRSDIFSMGIVLAEMLCGRRLFAAAADLEVLLMVRRADLSRFEKYAPHIPAELNEIVRKALARDREQRFATAGEFHDAVAAWLASTHQRAGASRLAAFIAGLEKRGGDFRTFRTLERRDSSTTLSGTGTRLERLAVSEAAEVARRAFAAEPTPTSDEPLEDPLADLTLGRYDGTAVREQSVRAREPALMDEVPLSRAVLERYQLIDVLCEIGRERLTGLLRVKRGSKYKEAYFVDGRPIFVSSNIDEDRFGQFLVRGGVITNEQLGKVLAALPHFGGRIGQALISLGLLTPVDAVRLLASQVEYKLIHACTWRSGFYEFRKGVENPWPALELDLDTFSIVGHGLTTIRKAVLEDWEVRIRDLRPRVELGAARNLDFEAEIFEVLRALDGTRRMGDVLATLEGPVGREQLLGATYVLWRCQRIQGL